MFLKIATILAILGLLLSLLLTIIQQIVVTGRYLGSSTLLLYRVLTIGEVTSVTVPLLIFFVAFFTTTTLPFAPGTAPRIINKLFSASTRATVSPLIVTRASPM